MFPGLFFNHITVDDISQLFNKEIEVAVLRLDKLHPVVSGNKWFKLKYYIEEAKKENKNHILTFGGAWSNHIVATAAACKMNNLAATGIIRGEEPLQYSSTLLQARELGMKLVFISREEYKAKKIPLELLTDQSYLINEGGYGELGAKGASTMLNYCDKKFTHYCCAVGTGTMMAGLVNSIPFDKHITGISVMKNNTGLEEMIKGLLQIKGRDTDHSGTWELVHDYHFGGYAKYSRDLTDFMNTFYEKKGIPSDFVYTGKLFFAISELIRKNYFPVKSKLLVIHSGGLQGNASLPKGTLIF